MKRAAVIGTMAGAVAGSVGLVVSGAAALDGAHSPAVHLLQPSAMVAAQEERCLHLMAGQDPSVAWHDGFFYLVQSENGPGVMGGTTGVYVYKSRTLEGLGSGVRRCIWRAPGRGPTSRNVWAPELVCIPEAGTGMPRWYVYFAADDGRNENHRMYALESVGSDPAGPYVMKGKVADATDRWAIDGTVLQVPASGGGRKLYFVWSGWEGSRNGMQQLYIAPMSNPWTISGPRVRISSPDQGWERRSGASPCYVNEAPTVLVTGGAEGRIFVAYSANGFWSDEYSLGLLSCASGDVLNGAAWRKLPGPAFARGNGLFATGHNCFVHVESGPEAGWWNVFHGIPAAHRNGAGRQIYAQRFGFGAGGVPVLGRPGRVVAPDVVAVLGGTSFAHSR